MRSLRVIVGAGILACAVSMGCGSDDEETTQSSMGITAAALAALPTISSGSAAASRILVAPGAGNFATGDAISDDYITNFFKFECHMPDTGVNDCPSGVTADSSNKYTNTTLMGIIYHAEMLSFSNIFGNSSYSTCGAGSGSAATIAQSSFKTSSSSGDTSKYMIDAYDLLECKGSITTPATINFAYNKVSDGKTYVMVMARKHDLATAGSDQSDIYQMYYSRTSAGAGRILAFNSVDINDKSEDYAGRVILLVNLESRRFLVQYRMGMVNANVTAAGKGGISASGAYSSGYYFVKTTQTPAGICVDNSTRTEVDASECANETEAWSGASDVATYLGLTSAEKADLAEYLAYFTGGATAADLGAAETPDDVTDVKHFPDSIQ